MSPTQAPVALPFDRSAETTGPAVAVIEIPFSPANRARWTYDESRDVYFRVNNGSVHVDALTSEQLYARNVVVMWAQHASAGGGTFDVRLTGSGRVSVFRNGVRLDGTWEADTSAPPRFTADDGTLIRLSPGNTWFQVVPLDVNISMQ